MVESGLATFRIQATFARISRGSSSSRGWIEMACVSDYCMFRCSYNVCARTFKEMDIHSTSGGRLVYHPFTCPAGSFRVCYTLLLDNANHDFDIDFNCTYMV